MQHLGHRAEHINVRRVFAGFPTGNRWLGNAQKLCEFVLPEPSLVAKSPDVATDCGT